jgi:hypothetical protein
MKKNLTIGLALAVILAMVMSTVALASDVDESIVDATAPTGSVTLNPGQTAPIIINLSVTGRQLNPASFQVNRDWTLSGGLFTGSNPQTFNVAPRAATDPATTFSTTGTITVAATQGATVKTLAVKPFNIVTTAPAALAAGDASSYVVTVEIPTQTDTAAPDITCYPPSESAWYGANVSVSCIAADDDSGLKNPADASFTLSTNVDDGTVDDAASTGTYQVCDNVGNCATAGPYVFMIDRQDPTTTATVSPEANGYGWNNTAVTVSFSGDDGIEGSGIASCSADVLLDKEGADQSASGTCTDKAGNVSAEATATVNIDLTDPTVSLVGGPVDGSKYYFNFVPAAPTCNADDALSGVDGACSMSGYSTAIGDHTITATANDKAGNSASTSVNYTVSAWKLEGFFQPVDLTPEGSSTVWNTVKNGSTVPLKFKIFAGPTQLTDTSFVVQPLKAVGVACSGGTADAIELTVAGQTSLRYDTTGGQFVYNWQTPKNPGACYKVTVGTIDGSSIFAYFKLK